MQNFCFLPVFSDWSHQEAGVWNSDWFRTKPVCEFWTPRPKAMWPLSHGESNFPYSALRDEKSKDNSEWNFNLPLPISQHSHAGSHILDYGYKRTPMKLWFHSANSAEKFVLLEKFCPRPREVSGGDLWCYQSQTQAPISTELLI